MADGERNNDDLYSLDYPELRRKMGISEADSELVVPTGETVHGEEDVPRTDNETSNADGDSNPKAATPELLELRDSTYVPVRTPSPPFVLSDEQREFDDCMRRVYAECIADEKRAHDDRKLLLQADLDAAQARHEAASSSSPFSLFSSSELQTILQARRTSLEIAERNYALGGPYQLLPPWPMRQRMQLLRYPELLAQYYELEKKVVTTLRMCSKWTRGQLESGQRMDAEMFRLNDMLNEVEAARKKDNEEKGDEKVLGALLDNMQARLHVDVEAKFGETPVDTERVAKLAASVEDAIARIPRLEGQLNGIRDLERSVFPERFPQLNSKRGRDSGIVNPLLNPRRKKRKH